MNLPNKLTIFRISMVVPIVVLLLLARDNTGLHYLAGILFIVASLTDLLDGYLARKNDWVTNFGKFMDPLADKLLVCAVLICLIEKGIVPSWAVILIVAREFAISGFRLIAVEKGLVLAASPLAKYKTTLQMIWTIYLLFPFPWDKWQTAANILMWISVVLTVLSFSEYILKNKEVLGKL